MKKEDIKNHFLNNKKLYISLGIGLTIGVVTMLVMTKYGNSRNMMTEGNNITVKNVIAKNVTVVTSYLKSRGHPGYIIRCVETGIIFPSQNYAAKLMELDPSKLSKHLCGMIGEVEGFHFERIAIAGQALAE